jgi:uncharacterized lipoprotein YajG
MKIKLAALKNIFALSFLFLLASCANQQHYYLFVGTYTNTTSKGIYIYDFNSANLL